MSSSKIYISVFNLFKENDKDMFFNPGYYEQELAGVKKFRAFLNENTTDCNFQLERDLANTNGYQRKTGEDFYHLSG